MLLLVVIRPRQCLGFHYIFILELIVHIQSMQNDVGISQIGRSLGCVQYTLCSLRCFNFVQFTVIFVSHKPCYRPYTSKQNLKPFLQSEVLDDSDRGSSSLTSSIIKTVPSEPSVFRRSDWSSCIFCKFKTHKNDRKLHALKILCQTFSTFMSFNKYLVMHIEWYCAFSWNCSCNTRCWRFKSDVLWAASNILCALSAVSTLCSLRSFLWVMMFIQKC
jgi:hypothetical protein